MVELVGITNGFIENKVFCFGGKFKLDKNFELCPTKMDFFGILTHFALRPPVNVNHVLSSRVKFVIV